MAARSAEPYLILAVDLDGLKPINDRHGHEAGDAAIKRAGDCLRASVRDADIVARMGGDEFTALVTGARAHDAHEVVGRIQGAVARVNQEPGRPHSLGLSIGWAAFDPERPRTLSELASEADQAMYRQKQERKVARE